MTDFPPTTLTLRGGFELDAPPEAAFGLFSPEGERAWVPGWDPETLHPPGAVWEEEMLFRTREERGDAIWVVTRLDRSRLRVVYHRVEPGRYVARVEVTCSPAGAGRTEVAVSYGFVGLTEVGNAEIGAMTQQDYDAKMERWRGWIGRHLAEAGP